MFSLIWAWIKGWVNNREAGDLRRHRAHYDVTVMQNIEAWTNMADKFSKHIFGKTTYVFYVYQVYS